MARLILLTLSLVLGLNLNVQAKLIQVGELGVLSQKKLASKGIETVETSPGQNGSTLIRFFDKNREVMKTIEVPASTRAQLDEFRPSKVQEYLYHLRTKSPHIVKTKLKAFPVEAFAFFFAIGAVTSSELVFNYAKNPVAMDQFIDMQMDPIGQIAFAAFIVANGLAAEPLMMVIQNKTLRYFVPYLGMTAGLMASNIVHEVGHFPHLTECAIKRTNCDKAYEAWLDYSFKDKKHEWAPSLVSMLISTAASGVIEIGIRGAGAQIARLVGAEIILSLTPTGWAARGGKWVYKVAQLAGFVYIDHLIIEPVNNAWQNGVGAGPELLSQARSLVNAIEKKGTLDRLTGTLCPIDRLKRKNEQCTSDFANQLFEFNKYMQNWQEFNFMPVMIAHQNWVQYLSQLAMEYHQAKSFYFDFISDTWKARTRNLDGGDHLLNKRGLFYGVYIEPNIAPELEDQMFRPNWVEYHQKKFLSEVLPNYFKKSQVSDTAKILSHYESKIFNEVRTDLLSQNDDYIARGISKIRWYLRKDIIENYPPQQSSRLYKVFLDLLNTIGPAAEPLRAPGELYLRLSAQFKEFDDSRKGPHYLFKQMLFGPEPDNKSNLIRFNLSGFPAEFIAPKITAVTGLRSYLPEKYRFESAENKRKVNYFNLRKEGADLGNSFQFLVQKAIKPEIVGSQDSTQVHLWWETTIDKQVQNALEVYSNKYKFIINLLTEHTLDKSDSKMNRSSFSNNLFKINKEAIDIFLALSYPSEQRVTKSLMPIQEWAQLSLSKAPLHIRELRQILLTSLSEAAQSIKSPNSNKAKEIISNLVEWQEAYNEILDMETGVSDRTKEVLKAAMSSQIERVKLWVQVTQALDFNSFVNGEVDTSAPRKCAPMGNGLGMFLRGNCN
jgi:hypothetical protein